MKKLNLILVSFLSIIYFLNFNFSFSSELSLISGKAIIVDGDTGGKVEHFKFRVKTLERLGVSAIIIEDKVGSFEKADSSFLPL